MKISAFYEVVFKCEFFCIADCTPQEANAYIKEKYNVDKCMQLPIGKTARVYTLEDEDANKIIFCLYMREFHIDGGWLSLFAHEVYHLVEKVLEYNGMHQDSEVTAFYLQHLFKSIYEDFTKEDKTETKNENDQHIE